MLVIGNHVWVGLFQVIAVYSIKDCTKICEYQGHQGMIHDMIFHKDHIWSCSSDKTIRVWSTNGECLHQLEGHGSRVFQLLHHNNKIFSASWDKTIMVWDPEECTFLQELINIHDDAISAIVSVNSTKPEVWSGSWDKSISVIRTANFSSSQENISTSMEFLDQIATDLGEDSVVEIVEMPESDKKRKGGTFLTRKVTNLIK